MLPKQHQPKKYAKESAPEWQHSIARKIRQKRSWRKLSKLMLTQQPVCKDPFGDHGERLEGSQQVHHIEPLEKRPDLALVVANLLPVCTKCHAKLEGLEKRRKGWRPKNWDVILPKLGCGNSRNLAR